MADFDPERIMFMKRMWIKSNDIPVLNVFLLTDSLGLNKICILNKKNSKGASFAFWVKIIS